MKVVLLLLLFLFPNPVNENWIERKNKNNITVYTRNVETSPYKEIKSTTRVKATLGSIVRVLSDVDRFTAWIYNCDSASLIRKVSDREIYSYQRFHVPWPASNRDVISRMFIAQDSTTKTVIVTSDIVQGIIAENENIVRVKDFHSRYILTPKENGWVEIDYEIGTDPGGIVPAWLVNMFIVSAPFTTQENLNRIIQQPIFAKTRVGFIAEK